MSNQPSHLDLLKDQHDECLLVIGDFITDINRKVLFIEFAAMMRSMGWYLAGGIRDKPFAAMFSNDMPHLPFQVFWEPIGGWLTVTYDGRTYNHYNAITLDTGFENVKHWLLNIPGFVRNPNEYRTIWP